MAIEMKYSHLRDELLSLAHKYVDEKVLIDLKANYELYICSNRKLSHIKDLKTLLKVLEKRDILSFDNVKPLSYICQKYFNEPNLRYKLMNYEVYLQDKQYCPVYNTYEDEIANSTLPLSKSKNSVNTMLPNLNEGSVLKSSIPESSSDKNHVASTSSNTDKEIILKQMVLSRISERIGRSWRDVARHLGILECQIDAIQNKYPFDLKEQSYEALKYYIFECNTDSWKLNLMRALDNGRRRDLKELVEELIMQK